MDFVLLFENFIQDWFLEDYEEDLCEFRTFIFYYFFVPCVNFQWSIHNNVSWWWWWWWLYSKWDQECLLLIWVILFPRNSTLIYIAIGWIFSHNFYSYLIAMDYITWELLGIMVMLSLRLVIAHFLLHLIPLDVSLLLPFFIHCACLFSD